MNSNKRCRLAAVDRKKTHFENIIFLARNVQEAVIITMLEIAFLSASADTDVRIWMAAGSRSGRLDGLVRRGCELSKCPLLADGWPWSLPQVCISQHDFIRQERVSCGTSRRVVYSYSYLTNCCHGNLQVRACTVTTVHRSK